MLTFSLDSDLDAIHGYDHARPEMTFPPLFELIAGLLEASLPSRVIALEMSRPDAQTGKPRCTTFGCVKKPISGSLSGLTFRHGKWRRNSRHYARRVPG